jgi:protein Mpv17
MQLWKSYQALVSRAPLPTKMATAAVLWGTIDGVTQWFEGIDYIHSRGLRQTIYGCFVHAPWTHVVWNILERAWPCSSALSVAKKVVIDQFISAPAFYFVYFSYVGAAQGENLGQIGQRLHRVWPTMQVVWCVWPFVHFVNFKYIPLHNRLLAALCVQLVFNSYISHTGNKPLLHPPIAGVTAKDLVPVHRT